MCIMDQPNLNVRSNFLKKYTFVKKLRIYIALFLLATLDNDTRTRSNVS